MHAFLSNLANRQTDKHGPKHLPPPLSELNKRQFRASKTKEIRLCSKYITKNAEYETCSSILYADKSDRSEQQNE